MRKSFKKGMAMLLAAAMVFSTPVALEKTAVKAAAETTGSVETLAGTAWWTGMQVGKEYALDAKGETALYIFCQSTPNGANGDFIAELHEKDAAQGKGKFITMGTNNDAWGAEDGIVDAEGNALNGDDTKKDTVIEGYGKGNAGIPVGHLLKLTASLKKVEGKDYSKWACKIVDVTDSNKTVFDLKTNSTITDTTKAQVHIGAQFGTFLVTTEEPIANALLGDVKAELKDDKIELSYTKKLPLDALSVVVSGSATKVENEITENLATSGSAVYAYPVTADGKYTFTLTASKNASAEGLYLDDVKTAEITLVKEDNKLYAEDDTLFTGFGVAKTTTDKVFKVNWTPAAGVTATATVKGPDGKAVGNPLTAPGNVTVSAAGEYTVDIVAKKGSSIKKDSVKFTYKAASTPAPGKTDKFSKITTKPLYKYTFDDAKEVTLSAKATVKDGVLNLAPDAKQKGQYYAKIDSMTADDFSKGITFIADINPKAYANDWTSIAVFGDGTPSKPGAAGASYRWAITQGFTSVAGPIGAGLDDKRTGYFGNEISQPYTWDYFNTPANRNKWYTIAVTVKKNEMITYINGVQVQKGTKDYSEIINGMKKSSNNYLGASYWDADFDFAGSMDDVAVYNTALSAADVKALNRTGTGGTGTVTPPTGGTDTAKVSKVSIKVPNRKAGKTVYMKKGDKVSLKATVTGTGKYSKSVTWKTSKKSVATVSSKGKVTAKKAGTAKITATSKTDKSKKATITIKVSKKAVKNKTLKISPTKKTLKKGKSLTIKIKKITKKTTDKITYKSFKKSVATVDAYGKVKAKKKGKATITVKCGKKKAKLKLTVKK